MDGFELIKLLMYYHCTDNKVCSSFWGFGVKVIITLPLFHTEHTESPG